LRPAQAKLAKVFAQNEKQIKSKKTGGVAQLVEHLPSKPGALSSISTPQKPMTFFPEVEKS
jgi:hypothetical protein